MLHANSLLKKVTAAIDLIPRRHFVLNVSIKNIFVYLKICIIKLQSFISIH